MHVQLPEGVRCAVALSYDLEMCAGYAPDGINHGRIMPAVQDYTLRLCTVAEQYGVTLHFFYVCNGLEGETPAFLQEILRRGHVIDSHTYSHQPLATISGAKLDLELSVANRLLYDKLGVSSTLLRGPFGYKAGWRNLPIENQHAILNNGFHWVSGEYDDAVYAQGFDDWVRVMDRALPYQYPNGLIEIPFHAWTDRMWFDTRPEVDKTVINRWRFEHGHQPVPDGWQAPWSLPHALDDWLRLNLATLDYAHATRKLWVPLWHPYTHYLHDPDCRMLEALLQHAAAKPERAWVCTVRDAAHMLHPEPSPAGQP